jgi:small subunit ribosomal protein S5
MSHLETSDTQRALEQLEPEDQAELRNLLVQVITESGEEDMEVLDRVAQFLSYHGAGIQFRLQHKEEDLDILGEFRALEDDDPSENEEGDDGR